MKSLGIIIKDGASGKYFGYMYAYPGICATGDSIDDVKAKIAVYKSVFLSYLTVEFSEVDEVFAA